MPCKKTEQLIEESQTRTLSKQELSEMQNHVAHCESCAELSKQNLILTNLIQDSSHIDDSYIIPQEIMRTRVETQLQSPDKNNSIFPVLRKLIFVPFVTVLMFFIWHQNFKTVDTFTTSYAYSVALNGISAEIVVENDALCDLLYSIGLPEASIDIIGCDTTCELVIFDLKTQQEAEKVVQILGSIEQNLLKTNIIKEKLHI